MEIIRDIKEYIPEKASVVCIGMFDGVHTGHKAILGKIADIASNSGNNSVVISFNPHPRQILTNRKSDLRSLSTMNEKCQKIKETGINYFCLIPFTENLSKQSYNTFFKDFLIRDMKMNHLVVSSLQTIGSGRRGDLSQLKKMAEECSFKLTVVEPVSFRERIVSSSLIRILISDGNIEDANVLLGYEYELSGVVIRGNQIGKLIGFPTANLQVDCPEKLIPANGVYACKIEWKGKIYFGMGNIGFRPTLLNEGALSVEAHMFEFSQDIYNEQITIKFVSRIRDEQKFGSLQLLKQQLHYDQKQVKNIFRQILIPDNSNSY